MIVDSVLELVGNTPMLRLGLEGTRWQLFLKLEKFNPAGSMKDRAAREMVLDAETSGKLGPGETIIESSSGNMAAGLAMVAAKRGYKFVAVLDGNVPAEKADLIRAYGGKVVLVAATKDSDKGAELMRRRQHAYQLSREIPNSVYLEQQHNSSNMAAYQTGLAGEILADVPDLNVLFCAIGTSGSICGTSRGLRELGSGCKVIAVEPRGSVFFSSAGAPYIQSGTGTPAGAEIPRILDRSLIDEGLQVTDIEAFSTCRALARRAGILLGGSAGGVLFRAIEYTRNQKGRGKGVVLAADGGEKYLSTIFNDDWVRKNDLLNLDLERRIAECLRF